MASSAQVAGVVLAAGGGSRYGTANKLLLPFRGRAVVYHAVRAGLDSQLMPLILVLGYQGEQVLTALEELRAHPKLRVVKNPRWRSGRASSVNAAIAALPSDAYGAVFLQGDMPLMTASLIDRLVDEFVKHKARICFPLYRGGKGHPVGFSRELLPELARLHGDRSGLALVKRYWDEALKLPLQAGEELTQFDLDTQADYLRLLELERHGAAKVL